MMSEQFIRDRITELRLQKGVSEYKMSLDLGHSKGYIQSISSGRSLPSMNEFLYICDYFGISPKTFFDEQDQNGNTLLIRELVEECSLMPREDLKALIHISSRLKHALAEK